MIASAVTHDITLRPITYALAAFVVMASGLADLPQLLSAGSISGGGILSLTYFCAGMLLLLIVPASSGLLALRFVPLAVFVAFAGTSLLWTPARANGIQNVVVISTMFMLMRVADGAAFLDPSLAFWIDRLVGYSAILSMFLYGASLAMYGAGTNAIIGARSFGVFALFGVCHFLARWRYRSSRGLLLAVAATALIGASQSRLALGIAVALFPLSQLPGARKMQAVRMAIVSALVAAASIGSLVYFDSLRDRFVTGDVSIKVGSYAINGSGRASFWKVTLQSFDDAPLLGHGAGSTEGLIESLFQEIKHAHNDYLRILHDYGLFGMVLWLTSTSVLFVSLWRSWRRAERISKDAARVILTAMLALLGFVLEMTTDNAMVYSFITAPLGLIVGSALGLRRAGLRHGGLHAVSRASGRWEEARGRV